MPRARMIILLAVLFVPRIASGADAALRGIAVDVPLDASSVTATGGDAPIIRVTIDGEPDAGALTRLDEAIVAQSGRGVRIIVAFRAMPSSDTGVETWRQWLRSAAERNRGKVAAYEIGAARGNDRPDPVQYAFAVKLAAVQLHSADGAAHVVQGPVPPDALQWEQSVLANGLAPYLDGLALDGPAADDSDAYRAAVDRMAALLRREKPAAAIVVGPIHVPTGADAAARAVADSTLRSIGDAADVTVFDGERAVVRGAVARIRSTQQLLDRDLVALDDRASGLVLRRDAADATAAVRHFLVYDPAAVETYMIYWATAPVDLEVNVRNAVSPKIRDPLTGADRDPLRVVHGDADRVALTLPPSDHALIVDFNAGAEAGVGTNVEVRNNVLPSVEEIVAKNQQAQAAQDAALHAFIAHTRIEQHFHPSPADPAYNIVTENRLFTDAEGSEWEELSFEVNGAKWGANRPSFPLLQPEKVLSLPLDLRLNQDYHYRLAGTDTVNGRPAFVVRFDPVDASEALYRGTVWIDGETYLRLKVQAVETRLSGPVVSNDETEWLAAVGEADGRTIWLIDRVSVEQVVLIAGRSVLVERDVHLSDFALNPPDFDAQRQSARAGNRIMYRDTEQGIRYLVKQGDSRVVSNQLTTSAKALALGADIDSSFDYPLPIGGVNILDFNFLHKNLQLALLYGGVVAIGNIQRANLWGGRFDASLDFFGLGIKANDDVFDSSGRRPGERVRHIPASVGVNLGFQVTPYQKVTAHAELRYDAYFHDTFTAPAFVIPSSTATRGDAAGYEYRRRGYSLLVNDAAFWRSTWAPWGDTAAFDDGARTYTKYDAGLSKDFVFKTFHTLHFNGTYFGGARLDRFSMYEFGMFDATRMHGVPSAVRFSELAMFRGSYSFNLFDIYRFDLFIDHARGRDMTTSTAWLPVTGTGVRVNFRTPGNTILQVDYGKSFLPQEYRGAGSTVVQILLLKPL